MKRPITAIHKDNRGSHTKFFTKDSVQDFGLGEIHEIFITENNKNTLRGLHRQLGEDTQQKLVRAITGKFNVRVVIPAEFTIPDGVLDEADFVEIAIGDNGEYTVAYFDGVTPEHNPIFAPRGAFLGYVALEDESRMLYMADGNFNGALDDGFNPHSLDIDWGVEPDLLVMSERDKVGPYL